jgi:methionyl-tRNA formyltransferase
VNVVFAGTPAFAVPTLEALLRAGHHVAAVYTQPDRPAGRGRQLAISAVKEVALAHELPVMQPATLKGGADALRAFAPEALIVVAYGLLLPTEILAVPTHGCLNVHASPLPRWRGAAPIQRAIEAGDARTGVTIMQMDAGLDTGDMLATVEMPIGETDTAQTLHDTLSIAGAQALVDTLAAIAQGTAKPRKQDDALATYARKLSKAEAMLDWHLPASVLARKVRAFNPWPVAQARWQNQSLRIWEARPIADRQEAAPGTVLAVGAQGIEVAAGEGALALLRVQSEGGKVMTAESFLHGRRLRAGDVLG